MYIGQSSKKHQTAPLAWRKAFVYTYGFFYNIKYNITNYKTPLYKFCLINKIFAKTSFLKICFYRYDLIFNTITKVLFTIYIYKSTAHKSKTHFILDV